MYLSNVRVERERVWLLYTYLSLLSTFLGTAADEVVKISSRTEATSSLARIHCKLNVSGFSLAEYSEGRSGSKVHKLAS
jgi:hypothetical protein